MGDTSLEDLIYYNRLISAFSRRKDYEGCILVAGRDRITGNFFADSFIDEESLLENSLNIAQLFKGYVLLYVVGAEYMEIVPCGMVKNYCEVVSEKRIFILERFVPDFRKLMKGMY
ncbi:hypothetical protein GF358_02615 [Candidatus Woesearchaeota archaeon]|nr:hypothetical protein [Candidatus Woesearchaeota archaeon]